MQERILVYGGTGSGKSYSWLTLAEANPNSTFHCIDTDKAIERLLATEFLHLSNVKVKGCRNWKACEYAVVDIKNIIKDDDWLVVDSLDNLWDFVQSYFVQEIFHKNIDEYFLQIRAGMKAGAKIETFRGWTDWTVINKLYQDLIDTIMYELSCNIFVTAKAAKYGDQDDEPLLKDAFSTVGYRPEGEKRNPYRVHTVLFFNHDSFGYYITTIKDRGRQQLKQFEFENFADVYTKIIKRERLNFKETGNELAEDSEAGYKAFGRWLESQHIRWSQVYKILGTNQITNYKEAHRKVEEWIKSKEENQKPIQQLESQNKMEEK